MTFRSLLKGATALSCALGFGLVGAAPAFAEIAGVASIDGVETRTITVQAPIETVEPRQNVRDDVDPNSLFDATNAFPGVVYLEFVKPGVGGVACSGTVINPRMVLTAAHCMRGIGAILPGGPFPDGDLRASVFFGADPFVALPSFVRVRGSSHIANAGFDPNAFYLGDDIGFVALSQPVLNSASGRAGLVTNIPYITLATAAPNAGDLATLVGYGLSGTGSNPSAIDDTRRRVGTNQVEFVGAIENVFGVGPGEAGVSNLIFTDFADPLDIPGTDYFAFLFGDPSSLTVTALESSSDHGDSGGPLFISNGAGGYKQVGITSGGGNACGLPNGGYCDVAFWTSVADFTAWLAANNPLKQVASAAGDAAWTSATHWAGGVVPDNFKQDVLTITDNTQPVNYYEVHLGAAGTTTLSDAREIDYLDILSAGAQLNIASTGNLFVWRDTVLNAGTLRVDGTLNAADLIMTGGRIQGGGNIIAAAGPLVQTGGTVAPGNSIGTLTVTGNYVLGAGALLEIEVTNGASDKLVVTGNAALGGTLRVLPFGALPLDGQVFTILTTGGTLTGTFGALDDQLPGLLFVKPVVYGSNFVRIEIDATSFALLGNGPVQDPVGGALDALGTTAGMTDAISHLQQLDPSQVPAALEALNPTRVSAQAVAGFTIGDVLREQLARRSYDLLGGSAGGTAVAQVNMTSAQLASTDPTADMLAAAALASAAAEGAEPASVTLPNGYGLYFAGDFAWTQTDQPGGIGRDDADVQALTGGLDYNDGKGSVFGAALSYLTANVDQKYGLGGDTEGDGAALSAFGATQLGGMAADVYATLGWVDYDTTRKLLTGPATFGTSSGSTESVQAQAGANFVADLSEMDWLTFSAVGGVHYISLNIDGYTETGAGALSAILPDREIESLKGMLGGQFALHITSTDSVVPFVRVLWTHEFSDDGLATSAAFAGGPAVSFTSPGPVLGDDWATLGAGFSGRLSPSTNIYVRYQGDFGRDGQDSHALSAAARIAF